MWEMRGNRWTNWEKAPDGLTIELNPVGEEHVEEEVDDSCMEEHREDEAVELKRRKEEVKENDVK